MTVAIRKPRRKHQSFMLPNWDNVVNEFMNTGLNDLATSKHLNYTLPAVNIFENEKEFVLEMAVPGLSKKDITLEVEKDYLLVSADIKDEKEQKYRLREFKYGVFKRKFYLTDEIDREKINAKFDNGLLNIHLLKIDKSKLIKTIKIS
jgi:HSP20 family protein